MSLKENKEKLSFAEEVKALKKVYHAAVKEKKYCMELDFCISSLLKDKLILYGFRVNSFPNIPKTEISFC